MRRCAMRCLMHKDVFCVDLMNVKGKLKMAHIDDIGAKDEPVAHIDEAPAAAIEDDDFALVIAEPNVVANDED